ncbi:MAG: polysaccharide pyruvyl transferase CsaB [Anaerovoracaceae bacterium]|jgi:polysaccharide pyruvyl transferase CsaB
MNIMLFAAGGDIGGGKTHILSLARELSENNQLRILSFRKGPLSEEGKEMGLEVIDMDNGWNVIKDLRMALEAVDRYKPDIIHCHGAKANMMGILVKGLRSIPVATTVHSDPKLDYLGMPFKQCTYGFINAIALRKMDFYMVVAEQMERNLIDRGFDPQKIFTIYNGLDFTGASEEPKPLKSEGDIVVGIAARLTRVKDITTLIRAFAIAYGKNNRLKLRIAGTGEDERELKALAEQLKVNHRVEFVGWVDDVKGFFSQVDINVLASLSEGFPYSLLEGAYEHCPAIASRVGGIPALISHGENGFLFEPGDVHTFADYIYQLSADEGLRSTLAENLFHRAKAEFSLQRMKEKQEEAYSIIMRRRRREGRHGAVICGAYGKGNAGDEAILKAILSQLRQLDPDMPFWIMSRNKKETRLAHKAKSMYIFNIPAFFRSLRKARIFVNGGGSLIQDITSSRSLYFYLFTLQAAKALGCRIIMYGCGIGPINKDINRRISAKVLNRTAETITLRDSRSFELLEEMNVSKPEIILTADPVINIKKSSLGEIERAFALEGIPTNERMIGFSLRNWPTFRQFEGVAAAARYAYVKYGLIPVFLPTEVPKDIDAAEKVVKHLDIPYYMGTKKHKVEDLIGMLGAMEAVVGMRLHALIFATAGGTPVIGISYDVKVDSFIRDIGSRACIHLEALTENSLKEEIDLIMKDEGRTAAIEGAIRLKDKEKLNMEAAKKLLEEVKV